MERKIQTILKMCSKVLQNENCVSSFKPQEDWKLCPYESEIMIGAGKI
jgi:hypothetical protein